MECEKFRKQHEWLKAYLAHAAYAIPTGIAAKMKELDVTLPEIDHIVTNGNISWADDTFSGCYFAITGRNCDEEEIKVFGWLNETVSVLEIIDIDKI